MAVFPTTIHSFAARTKADRQRLACAGHDDCNGRRRQYVPFGTWHHIAAFASSINKRM